MAGKYQRMYYTNKKTAKEKSKNQPHLQLYYIYIIEILKTPFESQWLSNCIKYTGYNYM